MEPLYRKVFIKSEQDIPKGVFFVWGHRKDAPSSLSKIYFNSTASFIWLRDIDWYLQPVEPQELKQTTEGLLPCPFCGDQPIWIGVIISDGQYRLRCERCQFTISDDRKDKVFGQWNQRYSQTQQPEIRDEEIETEAIKRSTWIIAGAKPWDQTDNALKNRLIDMAKWLRDKLKSKQP